MDRTVSQTARILGADVLQVKKWAWLFKDHLSAGANPAKGRPRSFTDADVLALMFVVMHWEDDPDMENIRIGLNTESHFEDYYREMLYRHTPLLREPPDGLDETWRHGILLNGGSVNQFLELARNYRQSAEAILDSALKSGEPREWGYPVLYAYRHTLELYLKVIGEIEKETHSLSDCVRLVEKRYRQRLGSPVREWIMELDAIDPMGTAFRYADDDKRTLSYAEYWVDFVHFRYAMGLVFKMIDAAILRVGARGRPAAKKRKTVNRKR
jgi:hypothetical protein